MQKLFIHFFIRYSLPAYPVGRFDILYFLGKQYLETITDF